LLPQELGLVIEEFVQGDEVGNYVVQQVCGPAKLGF
jgi:hypothetical protein